jgi:hypothetical protein
MCFIYTSIFFWVFFNLIVYVLTIKPRRNPCRPLCSVHYCCPILIKIRVVWCALLKLPNLKCNNNPPSSYSVAPQGKRDGRTERYNQTYNSITTAALYMEVCLAVCLLPSNGFKLVGHFTFNSRRETLNKSCRTISIFIIHNKDPLFDVTQGQKASNKLNESPRTTLGVLSVTFWSIPYLIS